MDTNSYKKLLKFNGDHSTLVGLRILNNLLKVVTLGIYYPWARASMLRYMYGESEFMGSRFVFHGTGNELFRGFLKAIAIFLILYIGLLAAVFSGSILVIVVAAIVFYLGIFFVIPLAIHGSYRYRMSRTSWRGIHFGYRGKLGEFVRLFLLEAFLSAITLGIYSSWFHVNVKKYIYNHLRFGNIEFEFTGQGIDLFIIRLKGFFFTILTLGIYSFWYMKELAQFEISNTKMIQNNQVINLRTTLSAGQIFQMIVVNYLIIIFTFGIGTGIAINRAMRTAFENIEFEEEINPDSLTQTEAEYTNATGDDIAGMLDIPLF